MRTWAGFVSIGLVLLVFVLCHTAYADPAALDLPTLAKKARPAVVHLLLPRSEGTGFVVSADGYIVTNAHVVGRAQTVAVRTASGALIPDARTIAIDTLHDVAVLKINATGMPFLPLGSTDKLEQGMRIAVVGNPLGLYEGTLSEGIVSALRQQKGWTRPAIQITAPISPGSSGSPVLNYKGEVIGIAVGAANDPRGQALNFAIPIEYAKALLPGNLQISRPPEPPQAKESGKTQDPNPSTAQGDPIFAEPEYTAFRAAESAKDYAKALLFSQELVRRFPNHPASYCALGRAQLGLKSWQDAIAAFVQAIKLKGECAEAWSGLGLTYGMAGRDADAITSLQQAIKLKPDLAESWRNLAFMHRKMGRNAEALTAYEQATKLSPLDAEAWTEMGLFLAETGRQAQAIATLQQAVRLKPDCATAWGCLVTTYLQTKQFEKAREAWDSLFKLDPEAAAKLKPQLR